MNEQDEKAERSLKKLGKRLRDGLARRHDTHTSEWWDPVQEAIIEQFAKETGKSVKELKEQIKRETPEIPGPAPHPDEVQKPEEW